MANAQDTRRIVVTGGNGYLGRLTCRHLHDLGHVVISLDITAPEETPAWQLVQADLADADAVASALAGAGIVIHLGANLSENDWTAIEAANIGGAYNVFEAARTSGVSRIIYASSHHVSGMYPPSTVLGLSEPTRPDSLYGLSKVFGEQLAQYYWDKYGLESVGLRIGSVRPQPSQARELHTWMSEADYLRFIERAMAIPTVGHSLAWGVSDNPDLWWSNAEAKALGYVPRDSSAGFTVERSGKDAELLRFQGGKRSLHALEPGNRDGGQ